MIQEVNCLLTMKNVNKLSLTEIELKLFTRNKKSIKKVKETTQYTHTSPIEFKEN